MSVSELMIRLFLEDVYFNTSRATTPVSCDSTSPHTFAHCSLKVTFVSFQLQADSLQFFFSILHFRASSAT